MSVMRPELIMKSIIPVVMAGIIAIYGLVVAVLIAGSLGRAPKYDLYKYVSFIYTKLLHLNLYTLIVLQWLQLRYFNVYHIF